MSPHRGGPVQVGRLAELWCHPVKSMRGGRVDSAQITEFGVPGDRGWAIRDEIAGEIRGAKKLPELLQCHARYLKEPTGAQTPHVEITLPDDTVVTSDHPGVNRILSEALGRRVTVWPRRPAHDLEHYRRRARSTEADVREQLALNSDDPLPNYAAAPEGLLEQLRQFVSPPGTYFDAFPLSVLTTGSLESLAKHSGESLIDSRRFRKNFIVQTDPTTDEYPEFAWVGRQLAVGSLLAEVVMPISRCVMVTLPQANLPKNRRLLRELVHRTGMDFGVYLRVIRPGRVREGDAIMLDPHPGPGTPSAC